MITADTITDEQIRALRDERRKTRVRERCDDDQVVRCCNAALGLSTSDGALGLLDRRTCRERIAKLMQSDTYHLRQQPWTAETITEEAARSIRDQALANLRDHGLRVSCDVIRVATHALGESRYFEGVDCRMPHGMEAQYIREARARCAEILNERAKAGVP